MLRQPRIFFSPFFDRSGDSRRRRSPAPSPPRDPKGGRSGAKKPRGKPRRGASSVKRVLLKGMLTAGVWGCIGLLLLLASLLWDLPPPDLEAALTRRPSVELRAANGAQIGPFGPSYSAAVPVSQLPAVFSDAVLAVEDRRFYSHFGIDPIGLLRAAFANIRAGRIVQGGSTITQQAAKNLFLTHERTLRRKGQELLLALWLERAFTKEQILTLYLNRVYFGAGAYGIDAAARRYFGVPAQRLSPSQSVVLAGLLKAPSKYNPVVNPDAAQKRAHVVLDAMIAAAALTDEQARTIKSEVGKTLSRIAGVRSGGAFADWVMATLPDDLGAVESDVVVKTTLDPFIQRQAENALAALLTREGKARNVRQGAVIVLSPDGAIRAMVGGKDPRGAGGFNRAVQARRQPGSAFKPFVYAAALEAGMTPETTASDRPLNIDGWSPENQDKSFHGDVSLRQALVRSFNAATVDLSENRLGRATVINMANRMGLATPETAGPAVALGVEATTLLALTAAYAPFANGGNAVVAYGVAAVEARAGGALLYRRQGSGLGRVLRPDVVSGMNDMLKDVLAWGTGRGAGLGRPAAGKSGTSQGYRDAWFIGYSADYVVGVWLGNDDDDPMRAVGGGGLPAELWKTIMLAAHKGRPIRPLP